MKGTNISSALIWMTDGLKSVSATPRLDAELICSAVTGLSNVKLITEGSRELTGGELQRIDEYLQRRIKGEPVAYLLGRKEFWNLEFVVDRNVLIPRPETEHIVEAALEWLQNFKNKNVKVLDLGTGSGCIGLALLHELLKNSASLSAEEAPNFTLSDLSVGALAVARLNAERLVPQRTIRMIESHWFEAFDPSERFDLIVSNPPYVEVEGGHTPDALAYEPQHALYSGPDGLDAYYEIIGDLPERLAEHGCFVGEIGASQRIPLSRIVAEKLDMDEFTLDFRADLAGLDRVMIISRHNGGRE